MLSVIPGRIFIKVFERGKHSGNFLYFVKYQQCIVRVEKQILRLEEKKRKEELIRKAYEILKKLG